MQQMNAYTYAVRMFCNSDSRVNTLELSGGVIEGGYGLWLQTSNTKSNKASLTITGGTIDARDGFAFFTGGSGGSVMSSVSVSILGGTINGSGARLRAVTPFNSLSITGGHFANLEVNANGGSKFVTGGVYESVDLFFADRTKDNTIIADGYKVVLDNGLYFVVPNSDPREGVDVYPDRSNTVYYYWLNGDGSRDGGVYNFYAPFEGPEPVLMDGEFVELLGNVKLTKDVTYIEDLPDEDWGPNAEPIFTGGTFYLTFGEFSIDPNGYRFPIPVGVTVVCDKQTNVFSAPAGYHLVEGSSTQSGFAYSYTVVAD